MAAFIISSLALAVLVYFGSIKLWNVGMAAGGKLRSETGLVDFALAFSATALFMAQNWPA